MFTKIILNSMNLETAMMKETYSNEFIETEETGKDALKDYEKVTSAWEEIYQEQVILCLTMAYFDRSNAVMIEELASKLNLSRLNFLDETWWFFIMKGFSEYCLHLYCYFHNVLADMSPGLLQKGRSSKFRVSSRVRQTPEEGRRIYRPKRCGNNNKDGDNRPKTFNGEFKIFKSFLSSTT